MISVKVIKVAALVSVAALYASVAISSVVTNVNVDYGRQIDDGKVALGVVRVIPTATFDVSYVALPAVGSINVSTKDGSVANIGVHVMPVSAPAVGSIVVDNGAIVPYAEYDAGISVDLSVIESAFVGLVHFVCAHPTYIDPVATVGLFISFIKDFSLDDRFYSDGVVNFHLDKNIAESVTATSIFAIVLGQLFAFEENRGFSLVNGDEVNVLAVNANDSGNGPLVFSEILSFDFSKALADTAAPAGVIASFDVAKALADTAAPADALSFHLDKTDPAGVITVADALISIGFNYHQIIDAQFTSLVDGFAVNEYVVHEHDQGYGILAGDSFVIVDFGKNVAELLTAASVITGFVITKEPFADSVSADDSSGFALTKEPFADAATVVTILTDFDITKSISEPVTAASVITSFNISKPLADAVTPVSVEVFALAKPLSDAVTADDVIGIGFNYSTVIDYQFTSPVDGFAVNACAVHEHDQGHGLLAGNSIAVVEFGKNVSDSAAAADVITGFVITKPLADSVSSSDSTVWDLTKPLAESVTAAGVIASLNATKPLSDSVTAGASLQVVLAIAAAVNILAVNDHEIN